MEKMRTLVANDPRVYREVIADALRKLRPLIEVVATEPEELEREVGLWHPHLVICSQPTAAVARAGCLSWVVLYPEGEDRAEFCAAGREPALLAGVEVSDLLSVVDETELRCHSEV